MSTKQSKNKLRPQRTLLQELEDVVLAIENKGVDENTLFGLVNCILKGYIRDGQFTKEYLAWAAKAMADKNIPPQELAEMAEAERVRKVREAFAVGSTIGS